MAVAENNSLAAFLCMSLANLRLLLAPAAALADDQDKGADSSECEREFSPLLKEVMGRRGRKKDKFPVYWTHRCSNFFVVCQLF